jgi:YVTN family beta-propeller protein
MRLLLWAVTFGALAAGAVIGGRVDSPAPPAVGLPPRLRQPVALALADGGRWLYAANRRGGTVSVIDTGDMRCVAEVTVGRKLSDLAALSTGQLLATDEEGGELIVLSRRGPTLEVARRLPVSPGPVSVQATRGGARCFVASLWPRTLTAIDLTPAPRVTATIQLPFAPRKQLLIDGDNALAVADAFGGRLAVVDVRRGEVRAVHALPAHNIRGLALSRDGQDLLVTHSLLGGRARTSFDDIHWGNLLSSHLRALPLAGVLAPGADVLRDSHSLPLGEVTRGAADPEGVAIAPDSTAVVALGGVGEVAVGPGPDGWQRLVVGHRPTAVVLSPDGRRAYVANAFADSVSVLDVPGRKVLAEIPLGPRPALSDAERGEELFHDARLAHDGWLSCHSCHTDGHTNGLLADTLADGSYDTPKRVLSLLGVKDTGPWAWNGGMKTLEEQVRQSVRTTMRGREPSADQVRALTAYLHTLPPPPPEKAADAAAVRRGRTVFERESCSTCHAPPAYTSAKAYDVGLADEAGQTHFNPPSLRGVGRGGPFFHDGRAATLEEVFTRHRHQLRGELAGGELHDLLSFLRSL